ncbi:MAG: SDR family oxidoreductase [Chloroflexota bacterium]
MANLSNRVAVVTGATRGAGRGIACQLGGAGATVYCSGRSSRGRLMNPSRPETIDETAEMVTARGGTGIAVRVDHTVPKEVKALFEQIELEQGRLDLLVNNVWGCDELVDWKRPFWEQSLENGLLMQERAVHTHMITSHFAVPLLLKSKCGLIIETTDGDDLDYRGSLYFDLAKTATIRLAFSMSHDLRKHDVAAVALTAGYMRREVMLEHFGVTEENWEEKLDEIPDDHFKYSETIEYIGRAVVALALDPNIMDKTGQALHTHKLAEEYGFVDVNGKRPVPWGS